MKILLSQSDAGDFSAGPFSFLVIVLMGAATVALIRNMDGRLKRLGTSFPPRVGEVGATAASAQADEGDSTSAGLL